MDENGPVVCELQGFKVLHLLVGVTGTGLGSRSHDSGCFQMYGICRQLQMIGSIFLCVQVTHDINGSYISISIRYAGEEVIPDITDEMYVCFWLEKHGVLKTRNSYGNMYSRLHPNGLNDRQGNKGRLSIVSGTSKPYYNGWI